MRSEGYKEPFTVEEVEKAIIRLKRRKAPGPDNLMAEHLIEGGQSVVVCLTNILNAIIDLEAIPDSFKSGLVVPVYKGSGKDHLKQIVIEVSLSLQYSQKCWNSLSSID